MPAHCRQQRHPTVTPGYDWGGELIIDRCLSYGALLTVAGSVWVNTSAQPYADHRAFGGAAQIIDLGGSG